MLDIEKLTDIELKLIFNGLNELPLSLDKRYYDAQLQLTDITREGIRNRGIEKHDIQIDFTYNMDEVNRGKVQGANGKWMK